MTQDLTGPDAENPTQNRQNSTPLADTKKPEYLSIPVLRVSGCD
jgi:hypothetical protein